MKPRNDPWSVLGLEPGASVVRVLVKELHPDTNPSADAAQKFLELQKAKDSILSGHADFAASQAARMRHQWRSNAAAAGSPSASGFSAWTSSPTFRKRRALAISGASFIAGCGLFIGALLTHRVLMDEYSPDKVEERLRAYKPQRERLLERIVMERAEIAAKKRMQQKDGV